MISADRMKSVLIAPSTRFFSRCAAEASRGKSRPGGLGGDGVEDLLRALEAQVGAAEHQQRRDRPGREGVSSSATGSRITSLLKTEPRAIFQTIGSSRAAGKPWTYFGVTAASSISAPAALVPALAASSTTVAPILPPTLAAWPAMSSPWSPSAGRAPQRRREGPEIRSCARAPSSAHAGASRAGGCGFPQGGAQGSSLRRCSMTGCARNAEGRDAA